MRLASPSFGAEQQASSSGVVVAATSTWATLGPCSKAGLPSSASEVVEEPFTSSAARRLLQVEAVR